MSSSLLTIRYRTSFYAVLIGTASFAPLPAQQVVLERYHVTAAPPPGGAPPSVTHSELHPHLPIDLGSLLGREAASITPVRRGGVASDVLLRGLGRDNVAVLLDGSPAHAACPGRMDPPVFHVSTPLVERIAVHAGPFDVRQGAAPGGSIAVTSAEAPLTPFATVALLAGSDELRAADFAVGGRIGRTSRALLGGSYQQGLAYHNGRGERFTELSGLNYRPEFRDADAFSIAHGELHTTWEPSAGHALTLRASLNDARDVLYPALMMDAQKDRSTRLSLGWKSQANSPLADVWRVTLHHHRVDHDMSDAFRTTSLGAWSTRGFMMRTIATTTTTGAAAEAELSRPAGEFVYGAQITRRNWIADNVIGPNANPMLPDATTAQAAMFVQGERAVGPWKLKAGARVDAWRTHAARDLSFVQQAHRTTANRRDDVAPTGFVLTERSRDDHTAIFAGLGHGARVPDPQERYTSVNRPGTGTDWVGNPNLPLVRATEITAGGRLRLGSVRLATRLFHSRLDNHIVLGRLAAAGSPANPARTETYVAADADLTGAEVRADVRFSDRWSASAAAAGQRGSRRTAAPGTLERDLPEIPPVHGRVTVRWQTGKTWAEAEFPWALRQTRLDATAGERPLPGYQVMHLRAERLLTQQFSVSLGVENVFDRDYASHNAYTRDPFAAGLLVPEPGRSFYIRVHWRG